MERWEYLLRGSTSVGGGVESESKRGEQAGGRRADCGGEWRWVEEERG